MEEESFENEEIANLLNQHFISVKVDREERPDIDGVYMSVCQMLTGSGGWPLSIIMTPEQKPFYAATYIPPMDRYGQIGLHTLLPHISKLWKNEKERLFHTGEEISRFLKQMSDENQAIAPTALLLQSGADTLLEMLDSEKGGFGRAPKFPTPHHILFLLEYYRYTGDGRYLAGAEKTLEQMYRGGIFDHLGGGFSRYSTDAFWLVPHFEKMLYDNALLIMAYVSAYEITKRPLYQFIAERTISYVMDTLHCENGGFCCGEDADSEGVEGKFYVFSKKEILHVLGSYEGEAFCKWFGVSGKGNFEGENILNLLQNQDYDKHPYQAQCRKLYVYRNNRRKLHRDDKILLSWNALMVSALAYAGRVFERTDYIEAAIRTAAFLKDNMLQKGRLYIRYRDGDLANPGQLEDYANYIQCLLDLYDATFEADYLKEACHFTHELVSLFGSESNHEGYFMYASDTEQLISRPKEYYDGAMPSGNSTAANVLVRLQNMGHTKYYSDLAYGQLSFLAGCINGQPAAATYSLLAVLAALRESKELVVAVGSALDDEQAICIKNLSPDTFTHGLSIIVKTPDNAELLSTIFPFTGEYPLPKPGTSAYYVCKKGACQAPIYDEELAKKLLL